jgi:Ca2+-binding EF-hand superfamily protein
MKLISIKNIGEIMKTLGHNPTEQEIKDLFQTYDTDKNLKIDFEGLN